MPKPRRAENQKVLPTPGVLSTPASPPIRRASRRQIDSPRPLPLPVWAESGEKTQPSNAEIAEGWRFIPAYAGNTGIGTVAALAGGRVIEAQLFGVESSDPLTLLLVVVLLGGTAMLACYLPARRATRVAPTLALRSE